MLGGIKSSERLRNLCTRVEPLGAPVTAVPQATSLLLDGGPLGAGGAGEVLLVHWRVHHLCTGNVRVLIKIVDGIAAVALWEKMRGREGE